MPHSAPAGAPVARLVRYAARRYEYEILVTSRITDQRSGFFGAPPLTSLTERSSILNLYTSTQPHN
jgi:hypothetical protein